VSADPLSPERGSYQFDQQMLRQVAYDTLSRRDRKTRHLKVAAHLAHRLRRRRRGSRRRHRPHYLDALNAIPDDPDTAQIRGQAIAALIRAGERAERTGAPARAAASYVTAAELSSPGPADVTEAAARLWERAAQAESTNASWAEVVDHAGRARAQYRELGQERAAARRPGDRWCSAAAVGPPRRSPRTARRPR